MHATDAQRWVELPQPFLWQEAQAAGLSHSALSGAVRRREVIKIAGSLYAVRAPWLLLDPTAVHVAMARAAQASIADSVVSHVTAALVHGLPTPQGPIGKVTLTARATSRTSYPDDWRRVLQAALPDEQVVSVAGVAVTELARTVVDSFRQSRLRDALAVADAAVRLGLVQVDELRAMRAYQRRWPGIRLADEGIGLVDGRRESWLESASVAVAHRRGYSVPDSQIRIHDLDGAFVGRVDHLWRNAGVIGEADGRGKYQQGVDDSATAERIAEVVLAERDRERGLEALGFAVARWGTADLRNYGEGMCQALAAARRRARPQSIRCLWRRNDDDPLQPWVWPPVDSSAVFPAA
ncbi:Transcriptional regulator, AbiEi antitoxin, Type IV TA system [Pedococcus dokdonensis]|uniref:Transcriptional regulator, AbiEi antitoxin, Type IV TA system n=1 Tax=Pedococcus dokdonensis TaxID=443156 RepID=A0A1H0SY54_9MICO|nr:hypothetical protein [Pedococcus dokdonensis]SDP46286.1 Transcriptional regulator, AbiEi antitoxin, Type IV TA system [Pedococcus dokdonensis]